LATAFVDTGAWIALMVQSDRYHRQATSFFRSIAPRTHLVTSNYVLAETLTWLRYHDALSSEVKLLDAVAASEKLGYLDTEWVTRRVHDQAVELFRQYDDHALSLCDCTSFRICVNRKVDFAFGFDADFPLMGIEVRPGPLG
jgi:predicted nucleic acid-binding protein